MMSERISQRQLEEIASALHGRDKKVLSAIRQCRYLTTNHIKRLYFLGATTPTAGLKAANRNLNKLKSLGLLDTLSRRVGGVRAGSGSLVWYLTGAGERLLRMTTEKSALPIRRFFEPSPYFLAHTLAVAECFIQLTEICNCNNPKLVSVEPEPCCWRPFNHKGKLVTLKPDLFAITICDEYEDRWFIEIDLDTEAPVTVVEKCQRYHHYYRCGLEQKQHQVFPLTVWIVPDAARKESLTTHIRAEFSKQAKLFIVITPDELATLLSQGVKAGALC